DAYYFLRMDIIIGAMLSVGLLGFSAISSSKRSEITSCVGAAAYEHHRTQSHVGIAADCGARAAEGVCRYLSSSAGRGTLQHRSRYRRGRIPYNPRTKW